ncbi:MAG: hypothetical protein C0412_06965 [Flavobacterium sp.]|nr:hypothetical protein [Flavobacterium sp.]
MKKILFALSLLTFTNLNAQPKVKLETIFSINDDKTTQKEYMFKRVSGIITDDENNFYVYENMGFEIRKFSKNGKYVKTIGRNGEGPGEFKFVYRLHINNKNELVIYDPPNYRVTYFNLDGKYLKSTPFESGVRYLDNIKYFGNNSYIALKTVSNDKSEHGNKIVVYDEGFKNLITSFGHSSIFWKYNDVYELHMEIANALNIAFNDKSVFVTKKYYDGKIYLFDKNSNWDVNIIEGRSIKKPGYDVIEKWITDIDWRSMPGSAIGFGMKLEGKNRSFTVVRRNSSAGLFEYKKKYLVNFLITWLNKKEYEFGIDVYNIDGTYLGYSKIDSNGKYYLENQVFCKDKEENFYMVTNGAEIRKFKLTIE